MATYLSAERSRFRAICGQVQDYRACRSGETSTKAARLLGKTTTKAEEERDHDYKNIENTRKSSHNQKEVGRFRLLLKEGLESGWLVVRK